MRESNTNQKGSILVWFIVILALFILGLFGYSSAKQIYKKKQVDKEINALKEEANKIEKDNLALEERIAYLGSQDYQELEAKDKLNLQSPNEKVVVVAEGPVKVEEKKEVLAEAPTFSEQIPNYKKWLKYFLN